MTQKFINPLKMGLLGGFAAWANTMEKYNMMNAQNEARQQLYKTKYDAMGQVAAERARNNALLNQMKLEANQRTSKVDGVQGDDGKLYSVTYRSVYNPSTQQYEQKEIGRVPYQPKQAAGFNLSPGQVRYDAQGNVIAKAPDKPDVQGAIAARQAANEDRRHQDQMERDAAKQQSADLARKIDRVETLTGKDMANWDKITDPSTKRQLLKDAGIDLPDKPGMLYGTNPPGEDEIESQRGAYEAAMQKKHAKNLGVPLKAIEEGAAPEGSTDTTDGSGQPTGAQPQYTPDGRQIKYDANGNAFIKGPDGKPVPYVADANGMPDSPLAMDTVSGDDNEASPDDQTDTGAPQGGAGLLAGTDVGADDEEAEPMPDDEDEEGEPQGLMSGQYA